MLVRLLSGDDLPGGAWLTIDQRTWRTGVASTTPWGDRARAAGSVTAWRSFRDQATGRWLWLQVMPPASELDARTAVDEVGDVQVRNLRAAARLVAEDGVDIEPFAGAGKVWAHEYRTEGPDGPGTTVLLAGAVGLVLLAGGITGGVMASQPGRPAWQPATIDNLVLEEGPASVIPAPTTIRSTPAPRTPPR